MRKNIECFFGIVSYHADIKEGIRNMVEGISLNFAKCQTHIPSKFVGLGVTQVNENHQGSCIILKNTGDITALIDGEIYNLLDLKTELMNYGNYEVEGTGDIIISAYKAWGPECFSKLNGMFAIALWDNKKTKLFLIRDPHGVKTLYYHFNERTGLTFTSRLSVVFHRKNISCDIEFASVQEYLRFLEITAPNTIYRKVYSLSPGCLLEYDGKTYSTKSLPHMYYERAPSLTYEEVLSEFEHILTKSIERRISNGKTGFFLSGGVDSATLCAIGAKIASKKIEAFTVGFDDENLNEAPKAERIARYLGIPLHKLYFNIDQYHDTYEKIVSYIDSPFADPAFVPTTLCFDYCAGYSDVAIDGTGADGLFGDMPPQYIRFALGYSAKLPRAIRERIVFFMNKNARLKEYTPLFDFEDPQELLIRWKGWSRKEIEKLCGMPCNFEHTTFYKVFKENSKSNALELYSALLSNMGDDRIHEMAYICNLTIRFPYWDEEFVAFVKKLPIEYKYKNGKPKFILKELLSKYIPREIWNTPKQGFNFPFDLLLKWKDFELIKRFLNPNSLIQHGLFSDRVVKDYTNRYIGGDSSVRFKIWALVTFQAWFLSHHRT